MESTGLITEFLQTLFFALATGLAGVLVRVAVSYLEKLGLEVDEAKQEKAERVALDAIMSVEERFIYDNEYVQWAEKQADRFFGHVDRKKAKLAAAMTIVIAKLPGVTVEEAQAIVDQGLPKLAELGIGGLGKQILRAMKEENYQPQ